MTLPADTINKKAYKINAVGDAGDPQRRTFINPTTQGDSREFFGQGRPMGKDSNTAWATGTVSAQQNIHTNPVTSHLAFEGTITSTDNSRVTDAREKGRVGDCSDIRSFRDSNYYDVNNTGPIQESY